MTKNFTPKILRRCLILIFVLNSLFFFAQNSVYIDVNWPSYSGENKIDLINSLGTVVLSFSDNYSNNSDISFSGSSNTVNLPNGNYTVRVYDRYGDDWNGTSPYGRVFVNSTNVFEFDGNFTNNTGPGYTLITLDYPLILGNLDDASFSYAKSTYCQSEANPTPNVTGESGGTFSSTSGLVINAVTGEINLSSSTTGNYVVTYTTTNPDQNSATQNVTIIDGDVATFSYPFPFAASGESDLVPTTTGQSGSYSSTSGLSINSSTGVIDVSASTAGTYTVSYTTNGSCPKVYTDIVSIKASIYNTSSNSYPNNATRKYIEYIPGTMPVVISAPHGGTLTGSELPSRTACGTGEMDDNTDILIREIQKKCFEQFGVYPYIIINNLRRNKLDPNRNKSVATCYSSNGTNNAANEYFDAYHGFIEQATADVNSKFGKGLYIDLHGQSHTIPRVEVGYNLLSSSFDENLNNTSTNTNELARVTIKNLIENNVQNLTFEDLIRGAQSFGGLMQVTGGSEYAALGHAGCSRSVGYRAVPSHIGNGGQGNCDDTNPGNNAYFAGDYFSNIEHGSGCTSNANYVVGGGGNVNGGGGTIDGIMTEVNRRVRDIGSTYSSVYGRSDTRSATIPYFSRDYGKVIEQYIDLHYNDFSAFSYSANSYDTSGVDPTPTISGISGGTFTSTSGLSINATTGAIDLSLSAAGTYTVSYNAPNIDNYYKKDFNITITELVPVNEFLPSTGNWSSILSWSKNRIPLATDNVNIPSGKTVNVDVSNAVAKDVEVIGTLNINAGQYLNVTGNLTTSGSLVVTSNATSSGSLIVAGNSTGAISYQRYIKNNSSWFVISSPLENQDIDVFANASALAVGTGNNRGLSNYNALTQSWGYYQNGTTSSGDFVLGDARAIRLSNSGNVTFTGDLRTTNFTKSIVSNGAGWNLIGNGFPSFLNANDPADSTNNLIDVNFSLLETGYKAIYVWDTSTNSYKPFNNASAGMYVSPGQGFFVKAATNGNFAFNKNMQTHQTGDLFLKGTNTDNFEINLKLSSGKNLKNTEIKYIKGSTTGLDDGYDAGLFSENDNLDIYTHLVENDLGTKYALQALPNLNHTNMIIPIGVNAKENTTITFSADIVNLPKGIAVYIEDKEADKLIRLDQNSATYQITTTAALNGKGRFFIHTQNQTLSTQDANINTVLVYTNNNKLNIKGLQESGTIKMFSILGKQVVYKTLSNNLEHSLDVSNLSKGVYLIEIKTNSQVIKRKVILE